MTPPVWVLKSTVLAIHDEQLAEHGGAEGRRDEGLLESALGKPKNVLACGTPGVLDLAVAYATGLVRNHPFVDGNKRISFMTAALFLARNGYVLTAPEAEAASIWLLLAEESVDEAELIGWLVRWTNQT